MGLSRIQNNVILLVTLNNYVILDFCFIQAYYDFRKQIGQSYVLLFTVIFEFIL